MSPGDPPVEICCRFFRFFQGKRFDDVSCICRLPCSVYLSLYTLMYASTRFAQVRDDADGGLRGFARGRDGKMQTTFCARLLHFLQTLLAYALHRLKRSGILGS